jgi:cysteine desulfurase/selenocysteine lyase
MTTMSHAESGAARRPARTAALDPHALRADFPALAQLVHGKPLVYLDNAATTQKPAPVLHALRRFYERDCSNIHRGVHTLSERATRDYEAAREKVARYINAREAREIVFCRGTTEAVNIVASSFGRRHVRAGDEVIISALEHHSNIVPWQMLCEEAGASLRVIPMDDAGELLMDEYQKLLSARTRIVAVVHVSNALGTVNPVKRIIELAHARRVPVLVDGAQAVSHMPVDVQALDCDFYAFSGHKLYGPTGVGVLYGKAALLEAMPPFQGGGDMIRSVTFEKTVYNDIPFKFEAGTPHIAGGIALGAAVDYVSSIGLGAIAAHEQALLDYATARLAEVPRLRIVGTAREKASLVSFVMEGVHPHDIGTILDGEGIAVRTGHHCSQPVMKRLGVPATARASMSFYNTREEIDALAAGLRKVLEVLG